MVQRGVDWSAGPYSNRQLAWYCREVELTRRSSDAAAPRHGCDSDGEWSYFEHADEHLAVSWSAPADDGIIELRLGADRHLACRVLC